MVLVNLPCSGNWRIEQGIKRAGEKEKGGMKIGLLAALHAVTGFDFGLGKAVGAFIKYSPITYDGDGGDGSFDYMRYAMHQSLPSIAKSIGHLYERDPPRKTNLRFKHASVQEVLANFNNSLVSNCPARMFNRDQCTANSTYSDIHLFEDKMVDAVVVVIANNKQRKIVVSYRATLAAQNALDDLNGALVDLPGAPEGARVHRGIYTNYLASYNKVRRTVARLLNEPRFRDYSVLVTGYSLGGAVATIAIADLTHLVRSRPDPRPIELISYAAPRAGNPEYAEYLASLKIPVTRLTLAYDIVSHTPVRSMGYTHAGQEIHTIQPERVGEYSIKVCSQEYDEDPNCAWAEADSPNPSRHLLPFGAPINGPPYY